MQTHFQTVNTCDPLSFEAQGTCRLYLVVKKALTSFFKRNAIRNAGLKVAFKTHLHKIKLYN